MNGIKSLKPSGKVDENMGTIYSTDYITFERFLEVAPRWFEDRARLYLGNMNPKAKLSWLQWNIVIDCAEKTAIKYYPIRMEKYEKI